VMRIFVRAAMDDPLTPVFRLQGFRQFATESVLYSEGTRPRTPSPVSGARQARSRDSRSLYHLYRKVTPQGVAQLEAPSYRDWRAIHGSVRGDALEVVVERPEVIGWARAQRASGARPHTLSFMAHPEGTLAEDLCDLGLGLLGEPGPTWSNLRHYDSPMIDALRGRGFESILIQALLVKELAQRVALRKPALMPSYG
jgi:hypothetical protein